MDDTAPSHSDSPLQPTHERKLEESLARVELVGGRSGNPLSHDEIDMLMAMPTALPTVTTSTTIEDISTPQTTPLSATEPSVEVDPSQFVQDCPLADLSGLTICDPISTLTKVENVQVDDEGDQEYILKEIFFNGRMRKIMTQNQNGPCPLIAVVNALVLRGKFSFNENEWKVSLTRVLDAVGDMILIEKDTRGDNETLDANVESALETLRNSPHGLDVNVRFGKVDDFEFTAVHSIFDILDLNLFHGWIADEGTLSVIGNRAYNEVTASITEDSNEARLIKEWLELNQSQLTFEGLNMLRDRLCDGGVAIMFRNNHFTTITKHEDTIYILLTDMGFICVDALVFESLVDINQSSSFFTNGNFDEVNADGSVKIMSERKMKCDWKGDTSNDLALAVSLQEQEMQLDRERRQAQNRLRNENDERVRNVEQREKEQNQSQRRDENHKKKSSCSLM
uniref:MINDY deubiquitinase domain-containing protein n=1 Tax=Pristionchus pacificus TaxID=54126 RepID=A0A8R1U8T1_PRIPA